MEDIASKKAASQATGRGRPLAELLRELPPEWREDLDLEARLDSAKTKLVVLDDDPTGTQTVHGVPVLTDWSEVMLQHELEAPESAFYVLTNSRSREASDAYRINVEIGRRLLKAAQVTGREFQLVSRSDSTLRGHFPEEPLALEEVFGRFDSWLVVPFFEEGGRYTINDVHYVLDGHRAIPVGETEYAKDSTFGFCSSNLREWVEEKTSGRLKAGEVASLSLVDIRQGGPERICDKLRVLSSGSVCVVNLATRRDLETFVAGLLRAEAGGRRFLYRTAASFVAVRAGIRPRPLLTFRDFEPPLEGNGGLTVVGSCVDRTTRQLRRLLEGAPLMKVEANADRLADPRQARAEIGRVTAAVDEGLGDGRELALFTSRRVVQSRDDEPLLERQRTISAGLSSVIASLAVRPRYIIAKGGITASDVATRGLGVKRAEVLGQLLPGVPVWRLGEESRYPGLPYVVFPGNVGGDSALLDAWKRFSHEGVIR